MVEPDVIRLSPNFNDAPVRGQTVIIHCTRSGKSGNPTEFIGTLNYMSREDTTSSQWVIGRELGQKARVVPDSRQAHHAAEDNDNTWGIEVCQAVEDDGFTTDQLVELVKVCRGYMADFGVPPVHARTSSEPGFIGHQETAQGKRSGKSDPGRLFPWDWFIAQLKEDDVPEHYAGEANERRAYIALNFNIINHYRTVYSNDGLSVQFIRQDGSVAATLPLAEVPDWAKPL